MSSNSESPNAQRISDEELVERVRHSLENTPAPFTTTSQVDDYVDEIKRERLNERLQELRDSSEIAGTESMVRGYVWWTVDDDDLAGAVDVTQTPTGTPDWENTEPEDIPPELREDVIEAEEEDQNSWQNLYEIGLSVLVIGIVTFGLGMFFLLISIYETIANYVPVRSMVNELGTAIMGIGLSVIMVASLGISFAYVVNQLAERTRIPEYPFERF